MRNLKHTAPGILSMANSGKAEWFFESKDVENFEPNVWDSCTELTQADHASVPTSDRSHIPGHELFSVLHLHEGRMLESLVTCLLVFGCLLGRRKLRPAHIWTASTVSSAVSLMEWTLPGCRPTAKPRQTPWDAKRSAKRKSSACRLADVIKHASRDL